MYQLQSLLEDRETESDINYNFDPLKHRIRCYAHIINLCSSHMVASTSPSNTNNPIDSNRMTHAHDGSGSDDQSDDGKIDHDSEDSEQSNADDLIPEEWAAGIKQDPLKRARKVIHLLRSSDKRRTEFQAFLSKGNDANWFTKIGNNGESVPTEIKERQLLRDVKTRWDSVFLMLRRLRQLRPVSYLTVDARE
jgi:hypothetical protein